MKLLFGTQSWLNALWILVALLSGPTVVASVWLVAAIAAEAGFVVLPDGAPRFSGPKGREADVTENSGIPRPNRWIARLVSSDHCAEERTTHPHPPNGGRVFLRREW